MKAFIKLVAICGCICSMGLFSSCNRKAPTSAAGAAKTVSNPAEDPFADLAASPSPTTGQWFGKLSGEWVSGDGAQSAVVGKMSIRFKTTKAWPELEGQTFTIGDPPSFETRTAHYTLYTLHAEPDMIGVIKRDFTTDDHSSFTLYREGTKLARSRPPLPEVKPPPEIQAILDKIPAIKAGEKKNAVLKRLGLDFTDKQSPRFLDGQAGLGSVDELWKLDPGNEWMCRISYTKFPDTPDEAVELNELKLVRGFAADHEEEAPEAPEIEYGVYPYYRGGKIVTGPSEAHPAEKIPDP